VQRDHCPQAFLQNRISYWPPPVVASPTSLVQWCSQCVCAWIGCGDVATLYTCQTRQVRWLCWGIVVVVMVGDVAQQWALWVGRWCGCGEQWAILGRIYVRNLVHIVVWQGRWFRWACGRGQLEVEMTCHRERVARSDTFSNHALWVPLC